MRTGYAIRMRYNADKGWLHTRTRVDDASAPVTIWGDEEGAMIFRRLKDAKAMLKVIRRDLRRPDKVNIIDRNERVVV